MKSARFQSEAFRHQRDLFWAFRPLNKIRSMRRSGKVGAAALLCAVGTEEWELVRDVLARTPGLPPRTAAAAAVPNGERARSMVLGLASIALGIGLSLFSWLFSPETGGRYLLFSGLVAFGIGTIVRNAFRS